MRAAASRLRIGEIPYLNCVPLFHSLRDLGVHPYYSFVRDTPARLNHLLARGEIDVAPCSSIEYACHADKYLLIPDISINARGAVKSVLLFSERPLRSLKGRRVALTASSASGAALLKILCRKFLKVHPRFIPSIGAVPAIPAGCEAALVIGDDALRNRAGAPYVFDLGALWYRFTRTPFVFSLWIARRDAFLRHPFILWRLYCDLMDAKAASKNALFPLARRVPQRAWISIEGLLDYWETLSYDLTERHITGLLTFYRYARDIGVIPRVPPLRFLGHPPGPV